MKYYLVDVSVDVTQYNHLCVFRRQYANIDMLDVSMHSVGDILENRDIWKHKGGWDLFYNLVVNIPEDDVIILTLKDNIVEIDRSIISNDVFTMLYKEQY